MKYSFKGKQPKIDSSAYVAPGAQIIGEVTLEKESSVWFNAVLRGDNEPIIIGEGSNIQDGSVVHVDPGYPVKVGKHVTVGHNVTLHGCTIEDGALIGMGATILNGAVIGKGALIAAGALVPEGKVIEGGVLAAGVPAKVIRQLSSEQMERIKEGAHHYVEKGRIYSQEGI
ncbi:gamma carbonic anhydrase family protein [Microaerobacter geothermalis]|uniref:gamma carbonic anhydrase family protein n=1 Tax=Microaerobacter geothermalis TaxID=674972 RepID=UPI001F45A565|nr:gamma carbonic anhydrase family protein [Microaerobacter geothermalis]MCF6092914.1 gamma carbonic anhydrase family protein [Microaerobacter geothermalis]